MADQSKTSDEQELLRAVLSSPAVGVPQHADDESRETWLERRAAQAEAYGQFVANSNIYWPGTGTLVFTPGSQVPIEHVEKWELETAGVVDRVATAAQARKGIHPSQFVIRQQAAHEGDSSGSGDSSSPAKTTAVKKSS